MASERQIAANRQNARKSTGPRSIATKKRVAQNAYRHGLSVSSGSLTTFAKRLNRLTRKIAGNTSDEMILQRARIVAQAELDIARVRRTKVALIERVRACGALERPQPFRSVAEVKRFLEALDRGIFALPVSIDPSATMPPEEPQRSAQAIRRVLPELLKLERYEQRASTRRDEAARKILLALETQRNYKL